MGLEGFVYSAYFPKYYVDSYAGTGFSVAGFISPELTRVPDAFLEIISNDTDSQSLSISLFGSEISVSGDISYVDDGFVDDPVSHKWNSITKGIYYVRPGGTVIVYDGTYLENVVVGDTITLKGIGMPVIDARGSRSPITISHDGATIDGFFIMGSEKSYPNAGISINSNNNTIVNNTISNNFKGIHVISGTNNTIDGNNISFNRISELSDGIYIESSNNNVINNYIEGNRDEGIQIYSDDNNIIGNTVVSNGNSNNNTGISIDYGSNNHLYHNNLINNSINANDVSSNIWDSGTEGNYWSDYSGIDSNSDGIGDTPYSIAGGDNKDNYPFMQLNGWLSITPPISATSAPTIDGVINSGEWLNKTSITLNGYYQPSNLKYGDLYVMNDDNNIYVAVVIPDTNEDSDYLMLDFDNGDDHIASTGREDAVGFNVAQLYGGTAGYLDYYWDGFWWAEDSMRHGAGAMAF
ncbi:MAG: right-handed parallel beta-helix repeat-containing protein, partial [Gammaproteobacteria bacterium]|nr:right-handed parallel beta-helix repeat-containing protein [Gammaproteobacteria bacterium]